MCLASATVLGYDRGGLVVRVGENDEGRLVAVASAGHVDHICWYSVVV